MITFLLTITIVSGVLILLTNKQNINKLYAINGVLLSIVPMTCFYFFLPLSDSLIRNIISLSLIIMSLLLTSVIIFFKENIAKKVMNKDIVNIPFSILIFSFALTNLFHYYYGIILKYHLFIIIAIISLGSFNSILIIINKQMKEIKETNKKNSLINELNNLLLPHLEEALNISKKYYLLKQNIANKSNLNERKKLIEEGTNFLENYKSLKQSEEYKKLESFIYLSDIYYQLDSKISVIDHILYLNRNGDLNEYDKNIIKLLSELASYNKEPKQVVFHLMKNYNFELPLSTYLSNNYLNRIEYLEKLFITDDTTTSIFNIQFITGETKKEEYKAMLNNLKQCNNYIEYVNSLNI